MRLSMLGALLRRGYTMWFNLLPPIPPYPPWLLTHICRCWPRAPAHEFVRRRGVSPVASLAVRSVRGWFFVLACCLPCSPVVSLASGPVRGRFWSWRVVSRCLPGHWSRSRPILCPGVLSLVVSLAFCPVRVARCLPLSPWLLVSLAAVLLVLACCLPWSPFVSLAVGPVRGRFVALACCLSLSPWPLVPHATDLLSWRVVSRCLPLSAVVSRCFPCTPWPFVPFAADYCCPATSQMENGHSRKWFVISQVRNGTREGDLSQFHGKWGFAKVTCHKANEKWALAKLTCSKSSAKWAFAKITCDKSNGTCGKCARN